MQSHQPLTLLTGTLLSVAMHLTASASSVSGDIHLSVAAIDFDYQEFDTADAQLNREDGVLEGFNIGGRLIVDDYFLALKLDYSRGEVDYKANINGVTLRSNTDQEIINYAITGGRRWPINNHIALTTSLSYGVRDWDRDIQSTPTASGLFEEYHWPYIGVNVEGSYQLDAKNVVALGTSWYRTQNADLKVQFKNGQFDNATLDLPNGDGYQAFLRWDYRWQPSLTLSLSPIYRIWEIPRSDTFPLTINGATSNLGVVEPRSETDIFELVFSVTKLW